MTYLLRKISPNKWQPNIGRIPGNHTADAITGCTRTTMNTLSVWSSNTNNFEDDGVKNLVVGLAVEMEQPAKIDLLWLEEDWLVRQGLSIEFTKVPNIYLDIVSSHKDIQNLDREKLGIVGEHIVHQFSNATNRICITRPNLISLVTEWVQKQNTFELDDLNEKWQPIIENRLRK